MTTFIVVWLFCGVIAVAIAAWKKLNVVAWVFIGGFLGVFAIILVLMQARARSGAWSAGTAGSGYGGGGCGGGVSGCGGGGSSCGAGGSCGGGCGGG